MINLFGYIYIQQFNNGVTAPGKYITIRSSGDVEVGKCYLKDGKRCERGTFYNTDGTIRGDSNYTAPAMALFEN